MIFYIAIAGSISWIIAYVLIARKGFKDKSYGMPLVPLALNFAWELVYSFMFREYPSNVFVLFNPIWAALDLVIIWTFFKYGYPYFKSAFHLSKIEFYSLSIVCFVVSILIMIYAPDFFKGISITKGDKLETTSFMAAFENIIISVCYVLMYFQRRNSQGQSFLIALFKFLVPVSGIISYLPIHFHPFMVIVYAVVVTFDVWYMILIYKQLKSEGHNPWIHL